MITSGWLVCYNCHGDRVVQISIDPPITVRCPVCDGTGEPVPGSYEGTPEAPQPDACMADEA